MSNISSIDKNFKVETKLTESDIRFYDVKSEPFKIYCIFFENGRFRRMPENVTKSISAGVWSLHSRTAGGRVRFKTDSEYVAISVKMPEIGKMPHFALTGSAGFDLYTGSEKPRYFMSFPPPFEIHDGYESVIHFGSSEMREITINFPLYSSVESLYIGLCESARVLEPAPYKIEKPIVYYGSSITQGGCASRPGSAYQGFISRRFNADFVNLGFSGNAKGEIGMAEYIRDLEMSLFVYDYDHNAPDIEHLERTHERMFKIIREKHPDLPVVMMSRPRSYTEEEKQRVDVVRKTYQNALDSGDKNVYFIVGTDLVKDTQNEWSVDSVHPTDLGFACMAKVLGDLIEKIL